MNYPVKRLFFIHIDLFNRKSTFVHSRHNGISNHKTLERNGHKPYQNNHTIPPLEGATGT